MSTQLHRSLTTLQVSLHQFLTQESTTNCRRRNGEGRSEQGGKKREDMQQKRKIERLIEEKRKINLIKET